jgi:Ca-activated chloride channel family protein
MTRVRSTCVLAACVLAGVAGVAAQQPIFRGTGEAVRVFVTVTDHDGRLVTTLSKDDFEVRDEGKPQPLTLFDNTPQPIRLIVMLDVSGSMEGNLPLLRESANELFNRLRRDDRARVGSFGYDIQISSEFTNDVGALRRALPDAIKEDAPTPLWRAVDEAMDTFGKDPSDERRVILVLSDGKDNDPAGFRPKQEGGTIFKPKFISQAEVIDRARREDVMVYAIGMRSRQRPTQPGLGIGGLQAALGGDLPDPGLAGVAEQTGGGYAEVKLGQDLGAAFARVADELHSQYLLGFVPPKKDGKVHQLDVRVMQKGLKPRGRKSYVAPKG